jgi:aminoglycoside phosphotransferase (APT) family kinase protein
MDEQDLQKIAEGREAEIFAWEEGKVLRLTRDLPGASELVEFQEYAIKAAAAAGVRVPAVYERTTVIGRHGLIMERVDGPDMLTMLGTRPWLVYSVGTISGRMQAQLHEVRAPDHLRELRPAMAEVIESSDLVPRDLAARALSVLEELPDGDRLCHGDFHPANIIETGRERVLIDWSNAVRADPAADIARTEALVRMAEPPPGASLVVRVLARFLRGVLLSAYHRSYRRHRAVDEDLVRRWEFPIATHRLTECIEEERAPLLRLLGERMAEEG